ncbi:MAG: thioredoxin family protein [Elusimicrobia bacterium]|nr:thioredoxin family protein [Candidatus Liberimonas magnetica]
MNIIKKMLAVGFVLSFCLSAYGGENKRKVNTQESNEFKVTFVELGSVNCVPCKAMQPVMAEIEKDYANQVKIIFYDVWKEENRRYADKYKIRAIPTQVFLDKDGKEFFRHEGFFPKEEIEKVLAKQGVKKASTKNNNSIKNKNSSTQIKTGAVCK